MGQITVFEKENCEHCKRVKNCLTSYRKFVLDELTKKYNDNDNCNESNIQIPEINIVTVDCGKELAYASFCIRATGSFTVPHIFFNTEYIGSADKFLTLDPTCDDLCGGLRDKLIKLAHTSPPSPAFPPPPDASLVKVTESLAFSSQPTIKQLQSLYYFGIKSVINILHPDSPAFFKEEESIVLNSVKESNTDQLMVYKHMPLYSVSVSNILALLDIIETLPKPMLVHDDLGNNAGLVVLLSAACEICKAQPDYALSNAVILRWAWDLGLNLNQFKAVISDVVDRIKASSSKS